MSVNEEIADMAITHAHYAERFKTYEVNQILSILRKADGELRDKLMKYDFENWTSKRYKKVQSDLLEVQRAYSKEIATKLNDDMKAFGGQEARLQKSRVEKAAGKFLEKAGVSYTIPTPNQLLTAANTTPLLMDDVAWDLKGLADSIGQKGSAAIKQSLKYSYATGESVPEAKRRLLGTATREGATRKVRRNAEMVVRTAMTHMSNVTRKMTFEENQDIVNGYEWLSTLDRRTTDVCQWRDGRVWMYDEGARVRVDAKLLPGEVFPPAHPQCRSTTIPVLKSWKDLGIDYKDVNAEERASMNGQVPGKTTYTQWIKKQPFEVQKEVLGKAKALALRSGAINIDQFYNKDGRMLTLDQLRYKGFKVGTPPKSSMPPDADLYANAKTFDNRSESINYLREKESKFEAALTGEEKSSWIAYKGSGYFSMNTYLRRGKTIDVLDLKQLNNFKNSFKHATKLEGPMKVYRGANFSDRFLGGIKPGSTITDKGFLSTTFNYRSAQEFAKGSENRVIFDLVAPKGKKYIPGISTEHELIFNSGSQIKIIGKRYDESMGETIIEGLLL